MYGTAEVSPNFAENPPKRQFMWIFEFPFWTSWNARITLEQNGGHADCRTEKQARHIQRTLTSCHDCYILDNFGTCLDKESLSVFRNFNPLCLGPSLEKVGVPHPVFSNLFGKVRMNSIEEGNSYVPSYVAFSMNYLEKLITLTRSSIAKVHDCGTPTWPTLCSEGPTCHTSKFTANQVTTDGMSIVFTFHPSMLTYGLQQTRHIKSSGDTRRRSPLYAEALGSAPASPSEVCLALSEPNGQVRPSKRWDPNARITSNYDPKNRKWKPLVSRVANRRLGRCRCIR